MDQFVHVRIIISIILGLSLTHLIRGSVGFIQHPGRQKPYIVHLLWVFYIFLLLIHFWWWEFSLKKVVHWYFWDYLFIVCYGLIFYIVCAILYPDDIKDYDGYKAYFYSRKNWFFGVLAVSFVADLVDTAIKGTDYFLWVNTEYYMRIVSHVIFCLIAIKTRNRIYHIGLVVLLILYEISYIYRFYSAEM